jgi:glycosyltransferase involved in cell wall biosynthesis
VSLARTVAAVIPALDEEGALPAVLAALATAGVPEVVVVDNGSSDGTARVARDAGATVVTEPRRGYGAACLAGLAALAPRPPEVVVFLDADGSDDPAELPRLLAPLDARTAELVIGSRVLGGAEPGALTPTQRFGNRLATALLAIAFGARFTDLGPFRAIRWESLAGLGMRDIGFGWTVEMQVRAVRQRLRITEVPVSYRRRVGASKITGTLRGTLLAGRAILGTIFRLRREPPP